MIAATATGPDVFMGSLTVVIAISWCAHLILEELRKKK